MSERLPSADDVYSLGRFQYGSSLGVSYFIDSCKKVLVESGTSLTVPELVGGLDDLDVNSLEYIAVTHIHLDHAGGTWLLLKNFPDAKVIVHEQGAEHLVDPSHLRRSVKRAVGDFYEYYGKIEPISENSIIKGAGNEYFDLNHNHKLVTVDSPGHAPHHLCFYDAENKILFTGDTAGLYNPDKDELIPTTPPPTFDLEKVLNTLDNLKRLDVDILAYTHWGWTEDPEGKLDEYGNILEEWVEEVRQLRSEVKTDDRVVERLLDKHSPVWAGSESEKKFFRATLEMNIKGILLYLSRRREKTKE